MIRLHFLGAAGSVTGSKHLLEVDGYRVLVDCGLFQGLKELRERNWAKLPIDPKTIHAVLLTHAHIDHTGYLPRFVKDGFQGTVYGTPGTTDLLKVMLPDSARIQEEDAEFANRKNFSKHSPALPLYTEKDAEIALQRVKSVGYQKPFSLTPRIDVAFAPAGHILGSSVILVTVNQPGKKPTQILFSGDLGRYNEPILTDPSAIPSADYLLMEATYGNRLHAPENPKDRLAEIINRTAKAGGKILIPAFAVGRTQLLLYYMRELEDEKRIPQLPIYVDSPMAVSATGLYTKHGEDHDLAMWKKKMKGLDPLTPGMLTLAQSVEESKSIMKEKRPAIIISASGMATGGRILHHLKQHLPNPNSTVVLVGYQAVGTRGARLQQGEKSIKIHGEWVNVNAMVENIGSLSAHADSNEILRWLKNFQSPPKTTFLVHGESDSLQGLQQKISTELKWKTYIPKYQETITLV